MLTGQSIDRHFYDNLNSYTGEAGSDGVVRVAAANLNFGMLRIEQAGDAFWIYFRNGVGRSKLTPAVLDCLVGSPVTARSWRTVKKLAELAGCGSAD